MRALIIEDEFTARSILIHALRNIAQCDVAVCAEEAFAAFTSAQASGAPYSLLLLDVQLPQMNGRELLRLIRDWESRQGLIGDRATKIIMTTGETHPKQIMGAFTDGCEAYLTKPYSHEKLMDELVHLKLVEPKKFERA